MTPGLWRQIEELYHSAREHGVGVLAYTDPELRREVERLLAQDSDGRILDRPAVELLEEVMATERDIIQMLPVFSTSASPIRPPAADQPPCPKNTRPCRCCTAKASPTGRWELASIRCPHRQLCPSFGEVKYRVLPSGD